jgi:aldehyde:ferredoxin oxidoreductase
MAYTGRILRVNLSSGKAQSEPLNEKWAREYLGGKGLAIKYLYEELKPGLDPLSAANKLVLMTGPLTGTIVPATGKLSVAAKSPATGTILDCSIGGHFAFELKYAGYDAVIIEGKAKQPVILSIAGGKVRLQDAVACWGRGAHETELALQEAMDGFKFLVIGQAGEHLVPMACISSELYRQAGRGGIGAVMGSKNLKAVAVKGGGGVVVPDIRTFMAAINKLRRENTMSDANMWVYTDGTPMIVELTQTTGTLPTRNFQQAVFEDWEKIGSEALKKVRAAKKACFACPLACGNYSRTGRAAVEGPEYETLALCGANCGIGDLEAVIEFNRLCDDCGLDTISAGNTAAFAMEMAEKGIYDFGLRFGDVAGYLKVPALIARREGIGADLALGVRALAEKYGGKEFAMQVKGLEFPGYEPRGSWGMGLAYATADRGACHMRAWPIAVEAFGEMDPFTAEGKAGLVKEMQDDNAAKFSAIFCDFWAVDGETQARILSAALGREVTAAELKKIGERIYNLARLFNQREGFGIKDDTLPARIFNEKLPGGPSEGRLLPREEFVKILAEYYTLRGWDEGGRVTGAKIKELGL